MKMLCRLMRLFFHVLFHVNIQKTFYLNFKMLPFKQAMCLPLFVYGKARFREMRGSIIIQGRISPGMIKIGKNDYYVKTAVPLTYWVINGKVIFYGSDVRFLNGGYMCISEGGTLRIEDNCLFGSNYKIMCFEEIFIKKCARVAYEVQICDTSFHYISVAGEKPLPLTKPIVIENNVWIGNRVTISKGTHLPAYAIVSQGSLVNKSFSEFGEGIFIAGVPASLKRKGMRRIFDEEEQRKLDKEYGYNRTHL